MRATTTTIHPAETTYMSKIKNTNQHHCFFEKKVPMPIFTFVNNKIACSATKLCLNISQQRTPPVNGRVVFFGTNIQFPLLQNTL